jgi:AraC family transcriptional activator of pobA
MAKTLLQDTIPFHKLAEQTDRGYQIEQVCADNDEERKAMAMGAHRDDHYIFLAQETGQSEGMIDFQHFTLKENTVLFILPGQVHSYTEAQEGTTGWFLAVNPDLISGELRSALGDPLLMRRPVAAPAGDMSALVQCIQLAYQLDNHAGSYYARQAIYSMLLSIVGLVASLYDRRRTAEGVKASRPEAIAREFRLLLAREYRTLKSPAEFALTLHLSAPYLNEAVKEATGFTVSYWIQQEVIMEAKRLLYHSSCSVKEIAYQLGYEDHTYFSRVFRKAVGRSPGEFRGQYRK